MSVGRPPSNRGFKILFSDFIVFWWKSWLGLLCSFHLSWQLRDKTFLGELQEILCVMEKFGQNSTRINWLTSLCKLWKILHRYFSFSRLRNKLVQPKACTLVSIQQWCEFDQLSQQEVGSGRCIFRLYALFCPEPSV